MPACGKPHAGIFVIKAVSFMNYARFTFVVKRRYNRRETTKKAGGEGAQVSGFMGSPLMTV